MDTNSFFRLCSFLRREFTWWFTCKHQSLLFVAISASNLSTSNTIVELVKKFFFFHGWIGNSMRVMMTWVVLRLEQHLQDFLQQKYVFHIQSSSMLIGLTKVPTVTPITPKVQRYECHFCKIGVMALANHVVTI